MYKILIDKENCIGCGGCESVCPQVFKMEGGKAVAKMQKTDKSCVKEAEKTCPVKAINIKNI